MILTKIPSNEPNREIGREQPKVPLSETIQRPGPVRFTPTEIETIIRRRTELAAGGVNDGQASKIIASGMKRNDNSVYVKIRELIKEGRIEENANKREVRRFTPEEIQIITSWHTRLSAQGETDHAIAAILVHELEGREAATIYCKIRSLTGKDKLDNESEKHERVDFSPEELRYIISRRNELVEDGLKDREIARRIAGVIKRSDGSVDIKLRRLLSQGELKENPKKQEYEEYTTEETGKIVSERPGLIEKGMTDSEIARKLAEKMTRTADSIHAKISNLVMAGELEENKNKTERILFTPGETSHIIRMRIKLVAKEMNDKQIAEEIAATSTRSVSSIAGKISDLEIAGKLGENPNKKEQRRFTPEEVACIIRRRTELEAKGMMDKAIARIIAKELGRTADVSIRVKIRTLIQEGSLEISKNARKIFTKSENRFIVRRRKELIMGKMSDIQIAKVIAGEMEVLEDTVYQKIWKLVRKGSLEENRYK